MDVQQIIKCGSAVGREAPLAKLPVHLYQVWAAPLHRQEWTVLLKRTLIVNAEKPVVIENLMIAQRRQDLIGEFTEFCSGDEL